MNAGIAMARPQTSPLGLRHATTPGQLGWIALSHLVASLLVAALGRIKVTVLVND